MEESIPVRAASRYAKVIEDYKARLKNNPDLKLSEYCKETHTNYNGVVDWTKRHAVSIRELRCEARGESTGTPSGLGPSGTFIQFVPSRRPASGDLRGVSITFPDGVNLTLQETSVAEVIASLEAYRSIHFRKEAQRHVLFRKQCTLLHVPASCKYAQGHRLAVQSGHIGVADVTQDG